MSFTAVYIALAIGIPVLTFVIAEGGRRMSS
jgi:hypothetical protein